MSKYTQQIITLHNTLMHFENAFAQAKRNCDPELVESIEDTFISQIAALEKLTLSVQNQLLSTKEALTDCTLTLPESDRNKARWERLQQEDPLVATMLTYLIPNGYSPEYCRTKTIADTGDVRLGQTVHSAGLYLSHNLDLTMHIPLVRSGDAYIGQNVISKRGFEGTITEIEFRPQQGRVIHALTIEGHDGGELVTTADTLIPTDSPPNLDAIANWLSPRLTQFKVNLLGFPSNRLANRDIILHILDILYQQWLTRTEKRILASVLQEKRVYHLKQTEGAIL